MSGHSAPAGAADSPPLRAGSVPYLNVAPIVAGLEHRLQMLPPSRLAVALRAGDIDAGLLSITEPLLCDDYDLLDGPCVASVNEVYSVILVHRRPLEDVQEVFCHTASLTSVNLLRVLLADRGRRPALRDLEAPERAGDHDFSLLIGNPAIEFRRQHPTHPVWDLGAAWRSLTGLPFVYAAWSLRRAADTTALRRELFAAADRGRRDREAIIRSAPEFDEAFRREYLTRYISSHLGPAEKAGIAEFARRLHLHLGLRVFPPRYVT